MMNGKAFKAALGGALILIVGGVAWRELASPSEEKDEKLQQGNLSGVKSLRSGPAERTAAPRDLQKTVSIDKIVGANTLDRLREARHSPLRTRYDLFQEDGTLTSPAINALGFDSAQAKELQNETKVLLKTMVEKISENVVEDDLRSDRDKKIKALIIKPFDSNREFDAYANRLSELYGKEKAGEILVSFPVEKFYNGFGLYEAHIAVTEVSPADTDGGYPFEILGYEAETGRQTFRITGSSEQINRVYPGAFNLHMEPLGNPH